MLYVRMWLEDTAGKCRNGWRTYLVMPPGRKWVKVIDTESADVYSITKAELELAMKRSTQLKFKPGRVARRLRAVAQVYGQETATIKEAVAALRAA